MAAVDHDLAHFEDYPGYELVRTGLDDLASGRESVEALLVLLAADRLRCHGIRVPESRPGDPKERLWALLERDEGDGAHARYNALVARVLSFANTADALHKESAAAG